MTRRGPSRWLVAMLAVIVAVPVQAQRAGLWRLTTTAGGLSHGTTGQSCLPADAVTSGWARQPANCTARQVTRTAGGLVSEAVCRGGAGGVTLTMRHELSGDLRTRFRVSTTTRVDGPRTGSHPVRRATVEARYLGACAPGAQAPASVRAGEPDGTPITAGSVAILLGRFALFLAAICATVAVPFYLVRRFAPTSYSGAAVDDIVVGADGSAVIPVVATFTGVRGLPWWHAIAYNNAGPLLAIGRDGIRFRVLRRAHRGFSAIENVDVRQALGTVNLDFTFRGDLLTFAANLGSVALVAHVLSLLPADVPLSARARKVLASMDTEGVAAS